VDNPDASWVITDSTREMIQSLTADAIDQGYTTDELAAQMEENFAFSPERAEMIARTETAQADSQGQMQGYEESGVVEGTEWTTAEDDEVDSDCVLNGEAGIVPLGEEYPSGDTAPPAHPNCRCAIIAALIDENSDSAKFEKLAVRDLVSRFMDACDSHPTAVAMQLAVRDTFGMKAEDLQNTALHLLGSKSEKEIFAAAAQELMIPVHSDKGLAQFKQGLQEFAKGQYDATQKYFADHGIKEMSLARGMKVSAGGEAKAVELKLQPASSFSVNLPTARQFAAGGSVFVTKVPVSQILGTYRTGYGCSNEHEVVVLAHSGLKAVQLPSNKAATMGDVSFVAQTAKGI
jgi:SPP1 gp7 family putative phage head morphogenesis protein